MCISLSPNEAMPINVSSLRSNYSFICHKFSKILSFPINSMTLKWSKRKSIGLHSKGCRLHGCGSNISKTRERQCLLSAVHLRVVYYEMGIAEIFFKILKCFPSSVDSKPPENFDQRKELTRRRHHALEGIAITITMNGASAQSVPCTQSQEICI